MEMWSVGETVERQALQLPWLLLPQGIQISLVFMDTLLLHSRRESPAPNLE